MLILRVHGEIHLKNYTKRVKIFKTPTLNRFFDSKTHYASDAPDFEKYPFHVFLVCLFVFIFVFVITHVYSTVPEHAHGSQRF